MKLLLLFQETRAVDQMVYLMKCSLFRNSADKFFSTPKEWRSYTSIELERHHARAAHNEALQQTQRRLATALDKYLLCEQSGFREGRSTQEQIMCHSLLVSDARRLHRQLYGTYIDFSKAFDSVPRWAIAAALRSWHTTKQSSRRFFRLLSAIR